MSFLLDVNVLVALAHQGHAEHLRVIGWFQSLMNFTSLIATCTITELGFVRVSVQAGFEENVPEAVETLMGLKASSKIPFVLLEDSLGVDHLPAYVFHAKQVTDGHLFALAKKETMKLATLDRGIPGALVIPVG